MSILKIVKDENLLKNIMQVFAYFAFIALYMRLGIPVVKGSSVESIALISFFIVLLITVYAFVFVHVIRPVVKLYCPLYTMRGVDDHCHDVRFLSKANFIIIVLALLFACVGCSVVVFSIK